MNAYGVKAGRFIPFVDKRVGGRWNCVIPLTRAIRELIRGGYDDALNKSTIGYKSTFLEGLEAMLQVGSRGKAPPLVRGSVGQTPLKLTTIFKTSE